MQGYNIASITYTHIETHQTITIYIVTLQPTVLCLKNLCAHLNLFSQYSATDSAENSGGGPPCKTEAAITILMQ